MRTPELKDEMQVVAASVQRLVAAGCHTGLSVEEATLAALVGLITAIRVDRLDEEWMLREARRAVPLVDMN